MLTKHLLPFVLLLPLTSSAETILGLYIFSRHGDRTSKSAPSTVLTDLGYSQVFTSGSYFRDTYVANGSASQIHNIADSVVKQSQIAASAPLDNVLFPSAMGFLQGLYPPVGSTLGGQKLRNGTTVETPLNGFQLIPVGTVTSGTGSEDQAWLQGSSNCAKAVVSSNQYFMSDEYKQLENSTIEFYQSLTPLLNSTFSPDQLSFKNAYQIYDYLNVASIHNATIPSSTLLTPSTLNQLRTLSDTHEYSLAYNTTSPIRAITGSTLAAQILDALNATITSNSGGPPAPKLNIQFGAYGGFQSFFGLANLTQADVDFYGVPDYASTMTFELFTTAAPDPFPAVQDLQVRFLFHNGTTSNASTPVAYPLFGGQSTEMSWSDFAKGMGKFAVGSQRDWCEACGNSTGVCAAAAAANGTGSESSSSGDGGGGNGISKAVAGVIGAMVTLAVILGAEAVIMLIAGLRLVRKKRVSGGGVGERGGEGKEGANGDS
ncbi:hypothetical protein ACLMJK_002252 [Lecanora helva]